MVVKGMAAAADMDRATILDVVATDMEGIMGGIIITTGMAEILAMVGMVTTVGVTGAKRATAVGDVEGTRINPKS